MNKHPLLSAQYAVLLLSLFLLLGACLDKPAGSIAGQIALQQPGFSQYSYDIKNNKVYALAIGPREGISQERGVWIKPDGTFTIDHLLQGEYQLKIRATGYSTDMESGIFVADGQTTKLPRPIELSILEPSVNIASQTRVFTSTESPHFWINASGSNQAEVKIYKKDFLDLLKQSKKTGSDGSAALDIGSSLDIYKLPESKMLALFKDSQPLQVLKRKLVSDAEDWAHAEFKLSKPLPGGDYVAVAEVRNAQGKQDWNLLWFTVTDLGLIVKQDSQHTLVRALDLNSLKARSDVQVQLYDRTAENGLRSLGAGKTGADGFVSLKSSIPDTDSESHNLLLVGSQNQDRAYGGLWFLAKSSDSGYQTYFYTERPIYRLGQTVYYKGISRLLSANGYQAPQKNLPLEAIIEDPDNNKIWQGKLQTNQHGTFNGSFEIPTEGKTGAYQLTLTYPDESKSYQRFEVAQYRKPEYQVEVTALSARVIAGTKAKARVKAAYFFGAPVANARVKYSIYASNDWSTRYNLRPRPEYYSYFDDWEGADNYYDNYGGDFVSEGYVQTDENGEALVEFDTKAITPPQDGPYDSNYMDKRYKIQAEVTDISRMSVIGSGYCSVVAGDFSLFIDADSAIKKSGESLTVNFDAINYDGKQVANQKVSLKLMRWIYDSANYTYKGTQIVEEKTASTNSTGKGSVDFSLQDALPSDTYYVSAQASDAQGHVIYDQQSLWIASANNPYVNNDTNRQPLSIKLDKSVYQPGDIARVMITAPVTGAEGAEALVAVEGTKLHSCRAVPLKATAQLVEIPLKSEYEPNVYVTVTFVGKKHQYYNESQIIKIAPQEHFLQLSVETDKAQYKPGDTVQYKIKATYKNGQPATNTELSLGVVDESIYSIRPEAAEDIKKFFYRRLLNLVTTACSFPEQYSGGPDKIEPAVRKDFRDTAAWIPNVVTDAKGMATASIKLPDNLTTWRATVRGIDMQTNVGSTINKVISTQDLIVRLALPRFFSEGDNGQITAVVHNYTNKAQAVNLTLAVSPQFEISQALIQKLEVQPDKAERYCWPVKVSKSGLGIINIKAIGQTAGDALERTLPVRPVGVAAFAAQSGLLDKDADKASLAVMQPPDASPATAQYLLSTAASSIGPVLGNFDKLIDYPYGCTEQTMSRLVPSIVAMKLHQDLGLVSSNEMKARFAKVYQQSMSKLKDYQHQDGGWGWWQTDESNAYLTGLVMEGLKRLQEAGYAVDTHITDAGKTWLSKSVVSLHKQLSDPKHKFDTYGDLSVRTDLAKMIYTLSLYNQPTPTTVKSWLLAQEKSSPETLTYLCLALQKSGQQAAAQECYRKLSALSNAGDGLLNWDHTPALSVALGLRGDAEYTYRFTGVETTALALQAVLAMEPQNTQRIESIKNWLLLQRDRDGWQNTKTTAQVFLSLLSEELSARQKNPAAFSLSIKLSDKLLGQWSFNQSNIYQPEKTLTVTVSEQKQVLEVNKSGSGRLYYNGLLTYTRHLKPSDSVDSKSLPNGVQIKRSFYRLKTKAITSDGKIHFYSEPINDATVKAGETVLMKVSINTPVALPYVILEAALPSGAEPVIDYPKAQLTESDEEPTMLGDWGSWWWTHQDVLDDRLVYFVTQLKSGKSEFNTMVRLEMPGTFQMNPVSLEGMYTKKVKAYSSLDTIKVIE